MLQELKQREKAGQPIRVGLIGAGAMGTGIALQIKKTPGMCLSFIAARSVESTKKAQAAYGEPVPVFGDADIALDDDKIELDVLVDATSSLHASVRYCLKAIERGAHVVLLNAEVDLWAGRYLKHEADKKGVVVTSADGDQHGVLMRMIDEIELWGFKIVQAGNAKGFLDRYATADAKRDIAKQLRLNLQQCVTFTDGTKLNVELALLANGAGLIPFKDGMEGPRATEMSQALDLFDFDAYGDQGRVDYLLGAKPGGGVYVVARCDDELQEFYMKYYKVDSKGPYHLFYRPYHLCHLEVPRSVALAALWGRAVLTPRHGRMTDVFAYAKQGLAANTTIEYGIGGDESYGLIRDARVADSEGHVPIGLLQFESENDKPRILRAMDRDEPITWSDVELVDTELLRVHKKQQELFSEKTELITE